MRRFVTFPLSDLAYIFSIVRKELFTVLHEDHAVDAVAYTNKKLEASFLSFQDIVKVIRSAGETLEELSKDAPSEDRINSTATKFLKSLEV